MVPVRLSAGISSAFAIFALKVVKAAAPPIICRKLRRLVFVESVFLLLLIRAFLNRKICGTKSPSQAWRKQQSKGVLSQSDDATMTLYDNGYARNDGRIID